MNFSVINANDSRALKLVQDRLELETSISMESFGESIARIMPVLASSMNNIKSNFRAVLAGSDGKTYEQLDERRLKNLIATLKTKKLINLMELRFFVPEGFKGNLTDYTAALRRAMVHADNSVGSVLTPFNVFLSRLLTDPNAAGETRMQLSTLSKIGIERNGLKTDLGKFISANSTVTKSKFGDVIQRMEDLDAIAVDLSAIAAILAKNQAGTVRKSIEDISELLDAVCETAREDQFQKISSQTLRTLGDATLQVAHEADFFAIVNYQANVLVNVMAENVEFLIKTVK